MAISNSGNAAVQRVYIAGVMSPACAAGGNIIPVVGGGWWLFGFSAKLWKNSEFTMKIIFRANDILEAHIVAGMLNSQGVETYVGGHYLQGAVGDLSALGFANVFVADEFAALAEQVLEAYQQAEFIDFPLADEEGLAPAG